MVSGLVTSPELQERTCLDEARPISIASKLLMSIKVIPCFVEAFSGLGLSGLGLLGYTFGLAFRDVRVEHRILVGGEVLFLDLLAGLEIGIFDLGLFF